MSNISSQNKNISVILSFTGTADSGFSVDIRISENAIPIYQLNGQKIPDAPELDSLYHEWQKYHLIQGRSISRFKRGLDIPDAVIGYSSVDKCLSSAANLVSYLERNWFGSDKFLLLKSLQLHQLLLKQQYIEHK